MLMLVFTTATLLLLFCRRDHSLPLLLIPSSQLSMSRTLTSSQSARDVPGAVLS